MSYTNGEGGFISLSRESYWEKREKDVVIKAVTTFSFQ